MAINLAGRSGQIVEVDDKNRLSVLSEVVSEQEGISIEGLLWNASLRAVAPSGAAVIGYIKNTGSTVLQIADIVMKSSAAIDVEFFQCTGTPASTTAWGTTNRYLNKQVPITATLYYGTAITGLTLSTDPVYTIPFGAAGQLRCGAESHIQVPPGGIIAIRASGAATISASITIYSEE